MSKSKKIPTRSLVIIALFSAISVVLTEFSFNVPLMPSFIKMDFSDFPSLLSAFTFGPLSGVAVQLIKNGIGAIQTTSAGVGELANFIMGSSLSLTAGIIYKFNRTFKGAVLGMICGCFVMAIVACFANYYIIFPLFTKFIPMDGIIGSFSKIVPLIQTRKDVMIYSMFPFNMIKGIIISVITLILYKRLKLLLK